MMISRLLAYALLLGAVAYTASLIDRSGSPFNGYLFTGVVSAQFAMLGVFVGIADGRIGRRVAVAAVGTITLCGIFLLRPHFNGWELLLAFVRLPFLCVVFLAIRGIKCLVFDARRPGVPQNWQPLKLWYLFAFTAVLAFYFSLVSALDRYTGPSGAMFFFTVIVLVGAFGALIPLIASLAALSARSWAAAVLCALAVLSLALCLGAFSYSQTDRWQTGLQWSISSFVEALTIALAILMFRFRGYHMVSLDTMRLPEKAEPCQSG